MNGVADQEHNADLVYEMFFNEDENEEWFEFKKDKYCVDALAAWKERETKVLASRIELTGERDVENPGKSVAE